MITKNDRWFLIAAVLIGAFISWQVIGPIIANDTIAQDDFRMSFFWVWKFWDPELFQDDIFTEIYENLSVYPLLGLIYKLGPFFTDNLVYYSKLLAFLIAVITTVFGYLYCNELLKSRSLALSFSATLATTLWCTDHVSAAHARSFIWMGLLAYMYFKSQEKHILSFSVCLSLLFLSPLAFLLCFGMEFYHFILKSRDKFWNFKEIEFLSLLICPSITLLMHKLLIKSPDSSTQYSTPDYYSTSELMTIPEFNPGGRTAIFGAKLTDGSWWNSEHWGLGIGFLDISKILIIAAALIVLYLLLALTTKSIKENTSYIAIFTSTPLLLLYSSLSFYFAAQITFPTLYMPSRYIGISSILLSLIAIYSCTKSLIEKLLAGQRPEPLVVIIMAIVPFIFWNHYKDHYFTRYVAMNPEVKVVIDQLPKDSLVAGHPLLPDLNMVSVISKRKVFMDYEHSAPTYNKGILKEFRRRNFETIAMMYASDKEKLKSLMDKNSITHLMVHKFFYSKQYLSNPKYVEPFNKFLKEQTSKEQLFLKDYLEKKNSDYLIIDRRSLD